jgi:hypothetical protein
MKRVPACRMAVAFALVLAIGGGVLAAVKVQTQFDETFDFTTLHSWAWYPDGAGQVMAASNQYDDPKAIQKNVEPAILEGVDAALTRRGFTRASSGEPDFYVTYYLLITAGTSAQAMGQFLPATTAWGLPPFGLATQSLEIYETGSLVIDVTDRASKHIVWRGVAAAKIDRSRSQPDREKRIRDGIADLLKQFPPKPKKK